MLKNAAANEEKKKIKEESKKESKKECDCRDLHEKIRELEEKVKEKDETLKRVQADFDNYSKFLERERKDFKTAVSADIIKDILPVLDDLEAAVKNEGNENVRSGYKNFLSKVVSSLKKHGLEPIDCVGKKFDPNLHEALMQEKSDDKEDGMILEEFQKGYLLNGKVLRHSKVKISSG